MSCTYLVRAGFSEERDVDVDVDVGSAPLDASLPSCRVSSPGGKVSIFIICVSRYFCDEFVRVLPRVLEHGWRVSKLLRINNLNLCIQSKNGFGSIKWNVTAGGADVLTASCLACPRVAHPCHAITFNINKLYNFPPGLHTN